MSDLALSTQDSASGIFIIASLNQLCSGCDGMHAPTGTEYKSRVFEAPCEGGRGWVTGDVPCLDWNIGEEILLDELEKLGYSRDRDISHWSAIDQYSPWDVVLKHEGCFISFDTKTSKTKRPNVTINQTAYNRAKRALKRLQTVMVYNPYTNMVAPMVDLVDKSWRSGIKNPLQSYSGTPYYVGNGDYPHWISLEDFLRRGYQ